MRVCVCCYSQQIDVCFLFIYYSGASELIYVRINGHSVRHATYINDLVRKMEALSLLQFPNDQRLGDYQVILLLTLDK